MLLRIAVLITAVCSAQAQTSSPLLKIPPIKTSVNLSGTPIGLTVWGAISTSASGSLQLNATVDMREFQENLTPLLAAQLDRADKCGERIQVQRAVLTPSGLLTANMHVERYGCVKAFGKEAVKRLVGGDGVVEVILTPSVVENSIRLTAQVRNIDANGSLGEVLHSGSLGESIRSKIAASIESAIQKSANLKSALPAEVEEALTLQQVQFSDGGAGRL